MQGMRLLSGRPGPHSFAGSQQSMTGQHGVETSKALRALPLSAGLMLACNVKLPSCSAGSQQGMACQLKNTRKS